MGRAPPGKGEGADAGVDAGAAAGAGTRPDYDAQGATLGVQRALGYIDGRWKLEILFRLFGGRVLRYSELERALPDISQKMLAQQLRQLERDGLVRRVVHAEVPPRVEYSLTDWGQSLCPALDALLEWQERAPAPPPFGEAR
ncbi:MAG: winged helix-turn-helix transcriptional regulator [Myxococcota bacterium]